MHNVRDAILVGGLFSVLILLAFLRSWRATLISALAIPTTLAITFLFLHWSGETLNLMSLGGLAVAIGLIIDDTVVVIENIARHLQPTKLPSPLGGEGLRVSGETAVPLTRNPSPRGARGVDAVDKASGEITGAVVGSTLTTVLVFLPLAFIVGVYGQFFAALSWSLSIAVLVSMVISLTLVPVFAAKFLAGRPMPAPGTIYNALRQHLRERPVGGAAVSLDRPWPCRCWRCWPASCSLPAFPQYRSRPRRNRQADTPMLVKGLETGLMPAMDEGAFVFDYWAPSGTPLAQTEKMASDVEKILSKNPDVEAYVRRTGAELGLFATQTSRGDIQVVLRPAENDPLESAHQAGPAAAARTWSKGTAEPKARTLDDPETRDEVRRKYRRRPVRDIMEEIEDEVKDTTPSTSSRSN